MAVWRKKRWIALFAVLAVLLVLVCGSAIYLGNYYRADADAIATFALAEGVTREVWEDGTMVFAPENADTGFVFYPGGKVEHTAYVPLAEALAARGILCVLVEMPFRLAVFDIGAAEGIPEKFPQVREWYIGGHSLGGSMAASYLEERADAFAGLVLMGAYSTVDLSDSALRVLSVYGSEDGVLNREKYGACMGNLPQNTVEIVIEGGNHAYFGVYGAQNGDGTASIANAVQIERTASEVAAFLKK